MQLTITTDVPSTGRIIFVLPKWDSQNRKSMVDTITTCSAGSDLAGNQPTCTVQSGTTQDQVIITNAMTSFGTWVTSGKTLQVTFTSVRNPPTLQVYSNFQIQTADTNGNLIEKCIGLSLLLQNVGSLSSQSSVVLESNMGLNQLGTYQFFVKLGNPMPTGGWIRIVLPPEISIVSLAFNALVQISQSASVSTHSIQINGLTRTAIDLKNGISSYIQEENAVLFELSGIKNPSSSKPTTSFEFYTFDNIDSGIDRMTSGLSISATQGALRNVKVYPNDNLGVLMYAKIYQLQFVTGSQIDSTNSIIVQFPAASFSMASRTCQINGTFAGRAPVSGYTCTSNSDTLQIIIKNFLQPSTTLSASSTVTLTIQNVYIRNPATTASPSSVIEVFTALDGYKIDYDASQTFSPSYSGISSVSVVPNSFQTNKEDVIYTVSVVPSGYVMSGAYINVTVPDEISISDSGKLTRQCGQEKLSGFKGTPECSLKNSNQIILRSGFSRGNSDDPPTILFSLPGMKNPRSLKQTSSFIVSIWDGTKLLYNSTNLWSRIQMQTVSSIKTVQIQRGSQVNGALTNFTFKITFNNNIANADQLVIENPKVNPIKYSNTTKCYGTSANLYYNQPCILEQDQSVLRITFNTRFLRRELQGKERQLQSFSASQATILITNVQNPLSLQTSSSFVLTQYTSEGDTIEASTALSITVKNNQSAELKYSQIVIKPDSSQTGVSTSYTIAFDPTNYVEGMQLIIQVPNELQVTSKVDCNPISGVSSEIQCSWIPQNRTIVVKNAFQNSMEPKQIKFQISNFTNPSTQIRTQTFKLYSFTSDGWMLDQREQDLYIDFKCSLPCKTCLLNNNTGCATCHNDNYSQGLPRHLWQNYCFDSCPLSTFNSSKDQSCQKCYDKICLKCTGPSNTQCLECSTDYKLINGNCVQFSDSTYYFPVLILIIIWLTVSIWASLNWEKTWFTTTLLLGLTLIEYIMVVIEALSYAYYGFSDNLGLALLAALVIPYLANVLQLILYLTVYKKQEDIVMSLQLDRRLHIAIVVVSSIFSHRSFKFLYSNIGNKPYLALDTFFSETKIRACFYLLQALSCVSSILCGVNALWNYSLSGSLGLKFTKNIDLERLILTVLVVLVLILEALYLQRDRPKILQKLIDKVSGTETIPRPTRVAPKMSNYDEIPNLSYATQIDGPQQVTSEEEIKRKAMIQVLDNLKQIRPELIEDRLQEMLDAKKELAGSLGRGSPLRKSEPDRLTEAVKRRFKTSPKRLGSHEDNDLEEERKLVTEPVTPRTLQKLGRAGVEARMDIREDGFPLDPKVPKITTQDQEVNAQRNSIDLEWESLKKEKEELKRMKEEIEQQRLDLEKAKRDASVSARTHSDTGSEKLQEVHSPSKKELYTARSRGQILDAVRESQSELVDDERAKKTRNMSLSKDQSKDKKMFVGMSRSSEKSNKSEILKSGRSQHKCHGQSPDTQKSIQKLRQKHGSSGKNSVNDSRSFNNRLNRVQGQGEIGIEMFTSPRNLQQYLNSNLDDQIAPNIVNQSSKKENQTKIYYSDKSESSVEDLMDETPSNYNIPNGRLEGRSIGTGAFLPPGFKDNRSFIGKSKKKKKRIPKIFREETTQELDETQIDDFSGQAGADSRSHSVLRNGKRIFLERRQTIPHQDQLSRAGGAASNISFDHKTTEQSEDRTIGQIGMNKAFSQKRGSQSNTRIEGILPINSNRIKALEAAYLTKLHRPSNKRVTPKGHKFNVDESYNQIINEHNQNMSQRIINQVNSQVVLNDHSLTQVSLLPAPQINNFNS